MSMQAVIFDMDGVIIDSEALWRQAQIDALAQWGATASVDECETLTKGKRLDDIAGTWCRYFQLDLAPQRLEDAILAAHHRPDCRRKANRCAACRRRYAIFVRRAIKLRSPRHHPVRLLPLC